MKSVGGAIQTDSDCEGEMSPNSFNLKMMKMVETNMRKKLRAYSDKGLTSKKAFRNILVKILSRKDVEFLEEPQIQE